MPPPTPAADSDLSLAAITGRLRAAGCVFAEQEAAILTDSAPTPDALRFMIGQRAGGLPLEHVVGWASFCGLRVAVDHGVFVPRRRSELLVRLAARLAASCSVVVDLACGCGAIGAAIAALVSVELHACDIDQAAVRCARRNLEPVGGHVYRGDLYQPLPDSLRHRVAVIAANVPYVPTDEVALMPAEARVHEPFAALDGGRDGLDVLRRAAAGAAEWLAPGGHLLVETSARQAAVAAEVVAAAGLEPAVAADADLGATVVVGRGPSVTPGLRR
jgi:release factor glutamine methyltransferase